MRFLRPLSALLVIALLLSFAPASVLAAPHAAAPQQAPSAAGASTYLLSVTPPNVSFPAQVGGFDAAGYVNIEHARRYAEVQAQLDALQARRAIDGFTPLPSAYAFVVRSPNAEALTALASVGSLQPTSEMTAAAVDALSAAYLSQLHAAVTGVERRQPQARPAPQAAPPQPERPQPPAVALAQPQAAAITTPNFAVLLNNDEVYGYSVLPGTVVTFTLKTPSGVTKGSTANVADGSGFVIGELRDVFGNVVFTAAGDMLEVQAPDLLTIPLPFLQVIPDAAAQRVTGSGPPNITSTDPMMLPYLELQMGASQWVTTTAAGAFAAENVLMQPGSNGWLVYANEGGHRVMLNWGVPFLAARGYYGAWGGYYSSPEYVSGVVVTPNAPVAVTLTRGGNPIVTSVGQSSFGGQFSLQLRDLYGNAVPIFAGDTLQAGDGLVTTTLEIRTFAVRSDGSTSTVSGATDATVMTDTVGLPQTLSLWPTSGFSDGFGKTVLAPGGQFSAANPFYYNADQNQGAADLFWGPGQVGHLRYLDAAGNAVFETFRALSPKPILSLRGSDSWYDGDNYVAGRVDGVCDNGVVALLDASNAVKAQNTIWACPSFSIFFVDVYGNPLPILAGDSVTANFGGQSTTVRAPSLTLYAYSKTDVVTGTITPGLVLTTTYGAPSSLAVFAGYTWVSQNVLPEAEGDFSADFNGMWDIAPGAKGFAQYIDANGNSVYAPWQAQPDKPLLHLRGFSYYNGENFVAVDLPAGACDGRGALDLLIRSQDGTARWQRTLSCFSTWLYLEDEFGNIIDLDTGDVVRATVAGQTTSVTVPSFDVTSNAQAGTLSGVTNAAVATTTVGLTQTLAVWPSSVWNDAPGKHVLPTASGVFSAANPFYWGANPDAGQVDVLWNPGDRGHLRYIDAGGNQVYGAFAAQVDQPLLQIRKDGNWVEGLVPQAGAPVTVTVKSGATVKGVGYGTSSLTGAFSLRIFDGAGNAIAIAEGDEIALAQPATTVAVPPLSVNTGIENDRVWGKGPANTLLNVYVGYDFYIFHRTVATDAKGDYALDLRGTLDLRSGNLVGVEYKNAQGHLIWLERYAGAMLSAALTSNRVWGFAPEKHLPVTVTVKRGGAVIGADSFINDNYDFTAFPINATGQPVVLAAGDVVELDIGSGVAKSLTLAALSLSVNEQANTVGGSGPPNSSLGLMVQAIPNAFYGSVMTDAAGKWNLNLAARQLDIRPGDTASVRYSINGSDMTWRYGVAPVLWLREWSYNRVHGYAAPYAPVAVTLRRGGSVFASVSTAAGDQGQYDLYLNDVNGLPVSIGAGDVVEVRSAQTASITVPPLDLVLNRAARTVSGVGPANAALGVFTSAGSRTVQTGADGTFSASFAAQTEDLYWAELRYREAGGNWIYATTQERTGVTAYLQARWDPLTLGVLPSAISGNAGGGPRQTLLSLRRGAQVVATASAWAGVDGSFTAHFQDTASQPVDILAGDVIEMAAGDVAKMMTIPPLTAQVNTASRTLFGSGPPNALLEASTCSGTTIDPGGSWVIECGSEPDRTGHVHVTDLQGNSTYLGWSTPRVSVREYGNEVDGTTALGAQVQVQLLRGAGIVAQASDVADPANGFFAVEFFSSGGSPVIIQPNDTVVVDAGQPVTVPVTPLTAAVDAAADQVTGSGPANAALEVYASNGWASETRTVTVGGDGSYSAAFAGAIDVRPGDWIDVTYVNEERNEVWLGWNTPLVRINLGSDIVDGYATPNVTAALALKRGGSVVATAEAQTGPDGDFSAFFLDGSGSLIDLVAGDVVELTASPTVTAAAIPLTAGLDAQTDKVTGSGLPGAVILVVAYRHFTVGHSQAQRTAVAEATGAYTADFANYMDLDQTSYAYVQAADAEGNLTSIATAPAAAPQREYAENVIRAAGATLIMSAYGTANGGNLTPPQAFNVAGGGSLIFYAGGGLLVVTAPDGTITRPHSNYYVVTNPRSGVWQVQVESSGGLGDQYAIAAGVAQYSIYLPAIQRH